MHTLRVVIGGLVVLVVLIALVWWVVMRSLRDDGIRTLWQLHLPSVRALICH